MMCLLSLAHTYWIDLCQCYQLEITGWSDWLSNVYPPPLSHSRFTELYNITDYCWYVCVSAWYVWWAEFRDCFASCLDLLTSTSSVTCWSCSLLKCWSVANIRPFSAVCSWNQHLITVAFQYYKAWPCQVNLPKLARGPGSHLGEWKIQAVPGKSHSHGAMVKRRARRNHTWDTQQQWIESKELRHSQNKRRNIETYFW